MFSLADLKALSSRTQITRHDCVEGWSAIGKWTGVPLGSLLRLTGLKPTARYVVLHCADELEKTLDGSRRYYESIDLIDAVHPQTILAYQMNGQDLSVGHGAPLRLRVERQLGYKQQNTSCASSWSTALPACGAETAAIGKTAGMPCNGP